MKVQIYQGYVMHHYTTGQEFNLLANALMAKNPWHHIQSCQETLNHQLLLLCRPMGRDEFAHKTKLSL